MVAKKYPRAPRLTIELTSDLIEASKQRDSSHCMIAEAVKSAFPDAAHVSVDLQTIRFSDPRRKLRYTYLTPRSAQLALIDFDQGAAPEPFSFMLRGGHVTASSSGRSRVKEPHPASEAEKAGYEKSARVRKQTLVSRGKTDSGSVAERVGGQTPPTTPFARRREFGLRALSR